MSIAEPPKRKRECPAEPKDKRQSQQVAVRLSAEELARITEPGHRKAVAALGRELALKAAQS